MEVLVVWLFFAALIGWAASSKGRSGVGWFLIAVLISPLIAGLIVLIVPRVTKTPTPVLGVADELTKLSVLRDSGAITPAEFDRQRAILFPPEPPRPAGPANWTG